MLSWRKRRGGKEVGLKTSIFWAALTLFPLMLQVWAPAVGSWAMAPARGCAQPIGCLGAWWPQGSGHGRPERRPHIWRRHRSDGLNLWEEPAAIQAGVWGPTGKREGPISVRAWPKLSSGYRSFFGGPNFCSFSWQLLTSWPAASCCCSGPAWWSSRGHVGPRPARPCWCRRRCRGLGWQSPGGHRAPVPGCWRARPHCGSWHHPSGTARTGSRPATRSWGSCEEGGSTGSSAIRSPCKQQDSKQWSVLLNTKVRDLPSGSFSGMHVNHLLPGLFQAQTNEHHKVCLWKCLPSGSAPLSN